MNPTLRHSSAHVFVESVEAPTLDEADRHHLVRVLRLRPGSAVTASDGRGRWVSCELIAGGGLAPAGPVTESPQPTALLTVAVAIPKGERPELIVQKLTEIGIDRIVFVATARSIVRWDEHRSERQLDRLRRVAREAAMQSRRVWLPLVEGVVSLEHLLGVHPSGLVAAEPGGRSLRESDTTVVIGPEGGFAADELPATIERVDLGATILRVETAAIVAATLLRARHSGT